MKKILSIIGALVIALTGFGYVYAQQTSSSWINIIDSSPNYLQTSFDPESPTDRLPLGDPLDPLPALYVSVLDALTANISALVSGDLVIEDITPAIFFRDTDNAVLGDNIQIETNCTDTTAGNEDCDFELWQDIAGSLTQWLFSDADGSIVIGDGVRDVQMDADFKMQFNQQVWLEDTFTGGFSNLGTIPSRGGYQYVTDQGIYVYTGDNDGNGNNAISIVSGLNQESHGHTTYNTNPTLFLHSATDPSVDDQQFISFVHDQTDGIIGTATGDLVLDPIGGYVVADGTYVGNVSASTQVLSAATQATISAATNRVASDGGTVPLAATPTIPAGTYDGVCKTFEGTDNTDVPVFQDESNLAGSTLEFDSNLDADPGLGDRFTVCWNLTQGKWYEDGKRTNN